MTRWDHFTEPGMESIHTRLNEMYLTVLVGMFEDSHYSEFHCAFRVALSRWLFYLDFPSSFVLVTPDFSISCSTISSLTTFGVPGLPCCYTFYRILSARLYRRGVWVPLLINILVWNLVSSILSVCYCKPIIWIGLTDLGNIFLISVYPYRSDCPSSTEVLASLQEHVWWV